MKALVVDDSRISRTIATACLREVRGIEDVEEAEDGYTAASMVARGTYDVILMDWNMPRMSGLEAIKAIRTFNKEVTIIMVTSTADIDHIKEALQAGANSYVIKPFDMKALAKKIDEALRKKPR